MSLLSVLASFKLEREKQGLTLAEVAGRSGLDTAMLSRLENGKLLNPTVSTLARYAAALGLQLVLSAEKTPVGAER